MPYFGTDEEIEDNFKSLNEAELQRGHIWRFKDAYSKIAYENPAKAVDYNFAPELDEDAKSTIEHYTDAESTLGKWDDYVQTSSDPICSSAGCDIKKKEPKYPVDYKVPYFGVDEEIEQNFKSLNEAELQRGHIWRFKDAYSKIAYSNPAKDVDYNFAPALDEDAHSTIEHYTDAEKTLGKWDLEE